MATEVTTTPSVTGPSPVRRSFLGGLVRLRELPVTAALILLVVGTWVLNPRFLSTQSVKDLLLNATIVMILAAGQAVVLITRNVDLSVGSMLGLSGFLTGTLFATQPGIPFVAVFAAGIALGALLGVVNGALVSVGAVPSLVITLGTMYIYRGLLNAWAGGKEYFSGDRPAAFGDLSVDTVLGFPIITLMGVAVVVVLAVLLAGTRTGRDFYAIGSDPSAATVFGIPASRRVFLAFVTSGALSGLGGVLYASRFSSVGATTGSGLELDVVAAAVVGGVAIFGGSGTVVGAAIGALLLTTITSALTAVQVDKFWQQALVGVLILVAVVLDRLAALRTARRLRISEARHG